MHKVRAHEDQKTQGFCLPAPHTPHGSVAIGKPISDVVSSLSEEDYWYDATVSESKKAIVTCMIYRDSQLVVVLVAQLQSSLHRAQLSLTVAATTFTTHSILFSS